MNRPVRPTVLNDIPLLRRFFRTSTWRDMSLRRFLQLMLTVFLWRRLLLSGRDALLNRYFGRKMGAYSRRLGRPFTFLYIGANDGVIGDTIMGDAERYGWHGILVEPVPHLMAQLKENFAHLPHQTYEQVAIGKAPGTAKLYTFRQRAVQPVIAQLLHSFSKEHLLKMSIDWGVDKRRDIVSIDVTVTTIAALLSKHRVKQLDLLVIDTEGYDYTILTHMGLEQIRPRFIKFETQHMSRSELQHVTALLRRNAYRRTELRGDYLCECRTE